MAKLPEAVIFIAFAWDHRGQKVKMHEFSGSREYFKKNEQGDCQGAGRLVVCALLCVIGFREKERKERYADDQSTGETGPQPLAREAQIPCVAEVSATPRRVPAGQDDDPEEAELRLA